MSVESFADLVALKEVGRIVRLALVEMAGNVRAGISTGALADIGGKIMRQNGARNPTCRWAPDRSSPSNWKFHFELPCDR
jgi:hypothetical protein